MSFSAADLQQYPLRIAVLPHGWALCDIASLASAVEPGFASGKHNREGRGVPHLRPMNVTRDGMVDLTDVKYVQYHDGHRLRDGDVLFNNTNSPALIGKTAVVTRPGEWAFSNHMTRIAPARGIVPAYLAHQLHYLWMSGYFRYRCVNHVNQASIASGSLATTVPVLLAPSAEQERIVAAIEEQFFRLDAAAAALARVRLNLKRMHAAVLSAAVDGALTATWRRNSNEPVTAVEPASGLPFSWHWTTWGGILAEEPGAFRRGPFGSSLKKDIFVSSGYKVYEQYCAINDDCSFGRYYITPTRFSELKGFAVRAGDFLISCSGVTLGRITQVPREFEEGVINQALLRVRLNPVLVRDAFFKLLFRSPQFQARIRANSIGTAIPNVKGVKDLKAIRLALPPVDEQDQIVSTVEEQVSALENLERMLDVALHREANLRSSILAVAFSGRMIPQDPNDEPASAVLECLAVERASSSAHKPLRAGKARTTPRNVSSA